MFSKEIAALKIKFYEIYFLKQNSNYNYSTKAFDESKHK